MKLIGKGMFSKVYLLNEKQVLIKSTCHVKECLSMNWEHSTIFPKIMSTDDNDYICKHYPKVKSLKDSLREDHYKIYQELRNLSVGYIRNPYDLCSAWHKEFKKISNKRFRDGLTNMLDNLCNYGTQIQFEISPRNVAVDNGRLILLDCFFMQNQADEIRNSKSKRYCY